jgi:hypothetical protein
MFNDRPMFGQETLPTFGGIVVSCWAWAFAVKPVWVVASHYALVPDCRATKLEMARIRQRFLSGRETQAIAFPFTRIIRDHFNFPRHVSSPVIHRPDLSLNATSMKIARTTGLSATTPKPDRRVHRTCGTCTLEVDRATRVRQDLPYVFSAGFILKGISGHERPSSGTLVD